MAKTLERAMREAAALPEADQEELGRQMVTYIERLCELRRKIDKGIRSLDNGRGGALDVEQFLRAQHAGYGRG